MGKSLVNPPLACTAVGLMPPRLAGMASGVNSTSRQVGTATGIAVLGTLFASRLGGAISSPDWSPSRSRSARYSPRSPADSPDLWDAPFWS